MKISKKLMSLLLVAMLLVTAIPFQAFAAEGEATAYTVKVGCFASHHDTLIETCGTVELTAEEIEEYKEWGADAELAHDILDMAGSVHADKAVDGNIHSIIFGYNGKSEIVVWLKDCGNATGNGPTGDPSNPEQGGTTTACTLTIVDGASVEKKNAYVGQAYSDFVGVRAAAGYKFLGWKSESYGGFIDITKDLIREDDTITATWAPATKYHITYDLDHNDKNDDSVAMAGITVSYGEHIYDKLYSYIPTREGYVFMGWKINGSVITEKNDEFLWQSDVVAYAKWAKESDVPGVPNPNEKDGKVYLEIYANGKTGDLVKRVDITSYAKDGKITREEVEKVAKKYVKAQAGKKLSFDGIFDEESWYWYSNDPETDGAASIEVDLWSDHYIFVMVNNVKATTNADTTNPKTGDFMLTGALTMMAISSISAAAVYLTGKKRK